MVTYESICQKLGFKIEDYQSYANDTEDDSVVSPFSVLTLEELNFVSDYMEKTSGSVK